MSSSLQYNEFVSTSFASPQFIFRTGAVEAEYISTSVGGDREKGVEFKLIYNQSNDSLFYKVYGNPYAVAAGELICTRFSKGKLIFGNDIDLEYIKESLDMPYNYFYILLALEDAWNKLGSIV